jgi:hypothetical protein
MQCKKCIKIIKGVKQWELRLHYRNALQLHILIGNRPFLPCNLVPWTIIIKEIYACAAHTKLLGSKSSYIDPCWSYWTSSPERLQRLVPCVCCTYYVYSDRGNITSAAAKLWTACSQRAVHNVSQHSSQRETHSLDNKNVEATFSPLPRPKVGCAALPPQPKPLLDRVVPHFSQLCTNRKGSTKKMK